MKMKTRPDDANMLQMSDWLAELREEGRTQPEIPAEAPAPAYQPAPAPAYEPAPAPVYEPAPVYRAMPAYRAMPVYRAMPTDPSDPTDPIDPTVRSVIGDQLRLPVMWCELGSCVSQHADPAALGEADVRARAIDAGWRIDAFGRLACPRCQQADPSFRVSRPVVQWDRDTAMTRATRVVTGC
jgi:hypothetical protein